MGRGQAGVERSWRCGEVMQVCRGEAGVYVCMCVYVCVCVCVCLCYCVGEVCSDRN